MRELASEFIGTFALVFAGTAAITINDLTAGAVTHVGVSLTFGLVILAFIYALGDVSGAHFNPAVTMSFLASGRFPVKKALPYILSQSAGAFLASILVKILFPAHQTIGATIPTVPWAQAFVLEAVLTFFLVFVILSVSTGSKEKGIMAGTAIGAVIALEALFAGPVTGASMNPVRSLAPAVISGHLESLWVYLSAPFLGALIAILGVRCVQEKKSDNELRRDYGEQ